MKAKAGCLTKLVKLINPSKSDQGKNRVRVNTNYQYTD